MIKIIIAPLLIFILCACNQGPLALRYGGSSPTIQKPAPANGREPVAFSQVNDRVFKPHCAQCHEGADEPFLSTYSDYKMHLNDIERTVIHTKEMPRRNTLSAEEIEIVKQWIADGAIDEAPKRNPLNQGVLMKKTVFAALMLVSPASFAHGNLAQQAHDAVTSSLKLFQTQEVASIRQFRGISANLVARETFNVTITLADNSVIKHLCIENEDVEPVVWECTKQ